MSPSASYSFLRKGKVRDIYSTGDPHHLLIIASDRISAFDHVLPNPIPGKGSILTQLSNFWFDKTKELVANHIQDTEPVLDGWVADGRWRRDQLDRRSVLVRKARPLPIEAIVRGYFGSLRMKRVPKHTKCLRYCTAGRPGGGGPTARAALYALHQSRGRRAR